MTVPTADQIEGELAQAFEALDDAEATLQQDRLANAINRGYYACFHAARAVLWSLALAPRTHKGTRKLFYQHLIQTQVIEKRFGDILRNAADERDLADYHAMTGSFDPVEVTELVADVRAFVEKMSELLDQERGTRAA